MPTIIGLSINALRNSNTILTAVWYRPSCFRAKKTGRTQQRCSRCLRCRLLTIAFATRVASRNRWLRVSVATIFPRWSRINGSGLEKSGKQNQRRRCRNTALPSKQNRRLGSDARLVARLGCCVCVSSRVDSSRRQETVFSASQNEKEMLLCVLVTILRPVSSAHVCL